MAQRMIRLLDDLNSKMVESNSLKRQILKKLDRIEDLLGSIDHNVYYASK